MSDFHQNERKIDLTSMCLMFLLATASWGPVVVAGGVGAGTRGFARLGRSVMPRDLNTWVNGVSTHFLVQWFLYLNRWPHPNMHTGSPPLPYKYKYPRIKNIHTPPYCALPESGQMDDAGPSSSPGHEAAQTRGTLRRTGTWSSAPSPPAARESGLAQAVMLCSPKPSSLRPHLHSTMGGLWVHSLCELLLSSEEHRMVRT